MWEIVIIACLSYGIWLVGDKVYRRLRPPRKTMPKKAKRHLTAEQLLGKCRHEVGRSKTNIRTYPITEQPVDKEHIFAIDNKTESSEPLPTEGTEEAFSGLEIPDVPLEFEQRNDNFNLGEEAEEIIPAANGTVEIAQGIDFEKFMRVLGVIEQNSATIEQQQNAGEQLSQMGENDIMEKLRSEPKRAMRIDELICIHFEKLSKVRITQENPFAESTGRAGDFDIRNYIN